MNVRLLLAGILAFLFNNCFSQDIITDTVRIDFKADTIIPGNYVFNSIKDNRKVSPTLVSFSQKNKYLLVPVDIEICLNKPLAEALEFNGSLSIMADSFALEIDYFIIEPYKGRLVNTYMLYANLPVKYIKNGIEEPLGTIIYNFDYKPFQRKATYEQVCEEVLTNWHRQFKIDMISVSNSIKNPQEKPVSLLTEAINKPYFFNFTLGGAVGHNFWQLEGEIHFTRPETTPTRWFAGSFFRYQNTPELEMAGFGKKLEHFNRRLSMNTVLDISSNFLVGLNKWKNTDDIKLWQVFQLSLSSAQTINFDKQNKAGLILKAGLFENICYIIDKKPRFQAGPYISAGYKF
ncbi:MAG: hypothetical protein JXB34_06620 [Bacteroidales bacterium]|nr:hypothetical protein [Bacteroidales bacterium]